MGATQPTDTTIYTTHYSTNTDDTFGIDWNAKGGVSWSTTQYTAAPFQIVDLDERCQAKSRDAFDHPHGCSLRRGHEEDHKSYQDHNIALPTPKHSWENYSYGDDPFAGA